MKITREEVQSLILKFEEWKTLDAQMIKANHKCCEYIDAKDTENPEYIKFCREWNKFYDKRKELETVIIRELNSLFEGLNFNENGYFYLVGNVIVALQRMYEDASESHKEDITKRA